MKQIHSKSFSFLLEFMIITLVFSLFAAVCVNIYATSININTQANRKRVALHIAQNVIATQTLDESLYFDEEGNEVDQSEAIFEVSLAQGVDEKEVVVFYEEESIINLPYYEGGEAS